MLALAFINDYYPFYCPFGPTYLVLFGWVTISNTVFLPNWPVPCCICTVTEAEAVITRQQGLEYQRKKYTVP